MTRPFTVLDCDQRSPEWFAARLGRLTGSRAAEAFRKVRGNTTWSADRKDLRMALALERITGQPQEDRGISRVMRDGVAREPLNRFAYECDTGQLVSQCGFLADNELPIGVSLDGYVGDFEGIIECKSPKEATHLETFTRYRDWLRQRDALTTDVERMTFALDHGDRKVIPEEYMWQIMHALYCSGAAWCDFVSFHPAFPEHARLVIIRVGREDVDLLGYETLVRDFLAEVEQDVERVCAA